MDNHNNTDCGIIDLKDDSSDEYTLESSEEEYDEFGNWSVAAVYTMDYYILRYH